MAYDNSNEFTDWLYNRYVEANRKEKIIKALAFLDVLNEYINIALQQRKFGKQRRHAKELQKKIRNAIKYERTHKLLLTGYEGRQEFEKAIADYERNLRNMNLSEAQIKELVIDKKWNYGNE